MVSMAPRTVGEALAGVSRAAIWFLAILHQVHLGALYSAILIFYPYDDPLYFSCASWRLPLLLSMYAYTSLILLILSQSHVELFLPRVPFAVYQTLLYGVFHAVVVGLLGLVGSFVIGLPFVDKRVVAGFTCFVALLIAGLLVLWVWLVREYGASTSRVKLSTPIPCAS